LIVVLFAIGREEELREPYGEALAAMDESLVRFCEAGTPDKIHSRYIGNIRFRTQYLTLLYDVIFGGTPDEKLDKLLSLHTIDVLQRQWNRLEKSSADIEEARGAADDLLESSRALLREVKAMGTPSDHGSRAQADAT